MLELRWVLFSLGLLLVAGVYLWSCFLSKKQSKSPSSLKQHDQVVEYSQGSEASSNSSDKENLAINEDEISKKNSNSSFCA